MDYFLVFVYSISLFLIFLFSLGQLHLTLKYLQAKKKKTTSKPKVESIDLPLVTVQLPIYNEKYVVQRLIESVLKLRYPKEKLEIQVLDDSTDETFDISSKIVDEYQLKGTNIVQFHRTDRTGFKAGALQSGLEVASGEYIVVFDADFLPNEDFLLNTIPYFKDPKIGMVQTRWGHVNSNYSLLTRLQAFGLDAHFTVEQTGRSFAGSFINFNGTAGVWRKSCILDAGGWSADTLTEDLDLSYRAQICGWKFKYLEDVVSPAELPVIMPAIKSQQYRWNKGAAETAVKNLGQVMKLPIRKMTKVHAILHLLNSSVFIPLLMASILSIPMLYLKNTRPEFNTIFHIGSVFLIGFFSIGFYYWIANMQIVKKQPGRYFLINFPLFLAVSMGLSLHNTIAVIEGYIGKKSPFVRTPKFNIKTKFDKWTTNSYVSHKLNVQTVLEGALGLYFLFGVIYGFIIGDFGLIFFHGFLAFGFLVVFVYSLIPLTYARR